MRFLIEGAKVIREAVSAGAHLETLFVSDAFYATNRDLLEAVRESGAEVIFSSDAVIDSLSETKTPQGAVGVCRFVDKPLESLLQVDSLLVAWGLGDPGNVGTAIRSAEGAGVGGVLLTEGCADAYNSKTVRASAGAIFRLPFARMVPEASLIDRVRDAGFRVVASSPEGDLPYTEADLGSRVALLVGEESAGLPPTAVDKADLVVNIPMAGEIGSVNAGVAASLLVYEVRRQRSADKRDIAEVVSAVNHDLRSPLTTLKGFASTLRLRWESLDDPLKREMIEQMELATDRLSRSISEVVDLARLNIGEIQITRAPVDTAHEVERAAERLRKDFPEVGINIHFDSSDSDVYADPDRYRQAVSTLVENAATHATAKIEVAVFREGDSVVVEVEDDGPGMSEASLEMVVRPPTKIRSPQVRPSGTGMSLYLVRELAVLQGGDLVVTSTPGRGSRVQLRMPAAGSVQRHGETSGGGS